MILILKSKNYYKKKNIKLFSTTPIVKVGNSNNNVTDVLQSIALSPEQIQSLQSGLNALQQVANNQNQATINNAQNIFFNNIYNHMMHKDYQTTLL